MLNAANLKSPSGYLDGQQDSLRVSQAPRTLARGQALGMAGSVMMRSQSPGQSFYGADAAGMTPTPYGLAIHDGYGVPVKIPPGSGPYPITRTVVEPAFNAFAHTSPLVIIEVLRGLSDGLSSSAIAVRLIDRGLDDTAVGRAFRAVYAASMQSGLSPQDMLRMSEENRPPQALIDAVAELGGVEWFRRFDQTLTAVPVSAVPTPTSLGEVSTAAEATPDTVRVPVLSPDRVLPAEPVGQVVVEESPAESAGQVVVVEELPAEPPSQTKRGFGLLPIIALVGGFLLLQEQA